LKSRWVQYCVRPSKGYTKAILEIYMQDGGTLGDVLKALLQMELLQTLEELKPKVKSYLTDKEGANENDSWNHPQYFSILSTLCKAFGKEDPCLSLQQFAHGLKCNEQEAFVPSVERVHTVLVRESGQREDLQDLPGDIFKSLQDLNEPSELPQKKSSDDKLVCRVLLIFANDGLQAANAITQTLRDYQYKDEVKMDLFRLDETTLWYEVLANPEAACSKWIQEVDFVMPILTPNFLREIHAKEGDQLDLLPLNPIMNRFMYHQMRARFSSNGCRNEMIRPVIPREFVSTLSKHRAVSQDLLFRAVWVTEKEEDLQRKARGMMAKMLQT